MQILDDVSNLIQTRIRDRLRLTTTGRPTIPRLERLGPIDRDASDDVTYAYAYRAPYCGALSFLPVFDHCGHHPIARRTFKRALVVIRLVPLN